MKKPNILEMVSQLDDVPSDSDGTGAVIRNRPCKSKVFQQLSLLVLDPPHDVQIARSANTGVRMRLCMFSLLLSLVSAVMALTPQLQDQVSAFYGNGTATGRHTNNWAVLVCSSRYWFNYRVGLSRT